MLTANLLELVANILRALELQPRHVAELVVLPELVAALHAESDDFTMTSTPDGFRADLAIVSTTWDHDAELRQLATELCAELAVEPTHVESIHVSAVTGISVALRYPQPIRLEVF